MYKYILEAIHAIALQECFKELYDWSDRWLMKLNKDKCKVLTISNKKTTSLYKYRFTSDDSFVELEHVNCMKDLGVTFESNMTFKIHISEKINKASQMLGIIKRNFKDIDKFTFRTLYTVLVRSQLEYAHAVWNPYKISLITDIEKVQRRATKLIKSLKRLPYKDRLIHLGLPTLKYRRLRGDMIEVYKILNDQYDSAVCPTLTRNFDARTRGNSLKLQLDHCKSNTRKFS